MITMMCRLMSRNDCKDVPTRFELCRRLLFMQVDLCVLITISALLVKSRFPNFYVLLWQSLLVAIIFIQQVFDLFKQKSFSSLKKSKKIKKCHSLASSYQFFSNRIHRLASQELKSFGMIDVPLDARTGRTFIV